MYNSILQSAFTPLILTEGTHDFFFNAWQEVEYKRGELITEAGETERYFYVVLAGVQSIYILSPQGEKKIIGFSYTGSFSGVYDSFLRANRSHYFLEAIVPSKMIRITKDKYDSLFERYPEFNYWGRIAHQELLIGRVNREIELITLSAQQRFDRFMKRCPSELLKIPQKHIASYLNMTPETYSRMRASKS